MGKWGNQLQWTGRQLQYNWTLPLVAAGAAATKFALDQERAMTRVKKVYDVAGMSGTGLTRELNALERAFTALSNKYGVTIEETSNIAAEWAAAGSTGLALAKNVELTMKTMVLGELEAADATKALIAIQAQYRFDSDQLTDTMARLNAIENATGTTTGDLIDAMSRAAGVARSAGIEVEQLGGMVAALTPAAGSASQAGNALKTIISRILAPTRDAAQLMDKMGLATSGQAWQSMDATSRIELLADRYYELSDSQKAVVSAYVASRYQINKFGVLLEAVHEEQSYYNTALRVAGDEADYFDRAITELNAVLDSNPQKVKQAGVILQNSMIKVIQPFLPVIVGLAQMLANLGQKFQELPGAVQKLIVVAAIMLALVGPLVRYFGSLATLIGTLGRAFTIFLAPLYAAVAGIGSMVAAVATFTVSTASAALGLLGSAFMWVAGAAWAAVAGMARTVAMGALTAVATRGVRGALVAGWAAILGITTAGTAAVKATHIALGPALARIWTIISITLSVIVAELSRALVVAWGLMGKALMAVTLGFASALGIIWRAIPLTMAAGLRGPYAIMLSLTANFMVAMHTIFTALWVGIQHIIVAGAAIAGGLWRAVMAGWIAIWSIGGATMVKVFTGSVALMTRVIPMLLTVLTAVGPLIIAALTSPWGIAAAAAIAAILIFWDELKAIFQHIVDRMNWASEGIVAAFNKLPEGVRNAFTRVIAFLQAAAKQVQEWLSYLNPFARHSPSLVDNVTAGMAVIRQQYGTLTQIAGPINQAYASIKRLKDVSASLRQGADTMKLAAQIKELKETAPQVVPAFRDLAGHLTILKAKGDALEDAINAQESVTRTWKQTIDASNAALDIQKNKLDDLKDVANGYKDQITELEEAISNLANTPLQGMGAMADRIFENEMAQKRLRLEIMDLEDAGHTYDDLRNKMAGLAGEIEMLRGAQADLRAGGAGSEILGFYDQQIAALEAQQAATEKQAGPINEAQKALEDLERQATRMDLQQSLQFDPLTRQIEQAANTMKELPFNEIIGQIRTNQAELGPLQTAWEQANAAVERQQGVVDAAQVAHDALQARYDTEQQKLETLKAAYGEVSSAISDVSSALSDMQAAASAANGAAGAISPAMEAFNAGAGAGDFADVGGTATLGREGGLGNQADAIDKWTKDIEDDLANSFTDIDMWAPFRDMWNGLVRWWDANVGPWITGIKDFFGRMLFGVDIFGPVTDKFEEWDLGGIFSDAWDKVSAVIRTVWDFATILWDLFGPTLMDTLGTVGKFFSDLWTAAQEIWAEASGLMDPLIQALGNLWTIAQPFVAFFIGRFLVGLELVWSVLNGALGPVLDWIIGLFRNIWQVIQGLIQVFIGLFTLDPGQFFAGLGNILMGLWGIVWDTIVSLGKTILGALGGLAKGLWDSMVWIADQLFGGLGSGIEAGIGKVWDWIVGVGQAIWDAITGFLGISSPSTMFMQIGSWLMEGLGAGISGAFGFVVDVFKFLWSVIEGAISVIGAIISWVWTNVLQPIVGFIIAYVKMWGAIFSWLWTNVIQPIFTFIGALFTWIWNSIIKPIIDFIILYIQTWAAIIGWLWTNVISPIFAFIGAIFTWIWSSIIMPIIDLIVWYIGVWIDIIVWLWEGVFSPIFGFIGEAFGLLGAAFGWVWENVIKPIFDGLGAVFKWVWENVLKPAFDAVDVAFDALGTALEWIWENIVKPAFEALGNTFEWIWENVLKPAFDAVDVAFDALGTALEWVWENVLKPVFDTFGTIVEGLKTTFETVVSAIETAWDGLKEIAAKPINFVIETVLNNGLIKAFNAVVGFFGLDSWKIDKLTPVKFASGGPVRGYSAHDSADNIPAWLTANEYVHPVAAVRKYGLGFMEAVRSGTFPAALARGFADGGTVDSLWRIISQRFPRANLNSGRRNTSDHHGAGNAVDLGERGFAGGAGRQYLADMANWIHSVFNKNITELIYTGLYDASPDMKNGRPLDYGTATNNAHRNHVHWAMTPGALLNVQALAGGDANGGGGFWDMLTDPLGTIEKGFKNLLDDLGAGKLADIAGKIPGEVFEGVKEWIVDFIDFDTGGVLPHGGTARNRSGSPERILSPRQTESFDRLITFLDGNRIPSGGTLEGVIFKATERAHRAEAIGGQVIVQGDMGTTNVTMNFYGDLEFPNINSGDDADTLIRNLSDLAGAR